MNPNWLVLPVIINFILTFIVQAVMYRDRVKAMKHNKVHPNQVVDRAELERLLPQSNATSNNFKNQFEIPVIFYAIVMLLLVTGWATWLDFYLAAGFVIMRIIHAIVHCTTNRIKHRFYSYLLGTWILWAWTVSLSISWFQHMM
ncbi:MAPEG family protein [Pleionea sediminis]|uniref:MAPEG family protein n=1 Tax=Pleionea sediminis TaxID=2569479 RepID=UPI0011853943|nr:MAPEG family protein [Pleionea sediminis]